MTDPILARHNATNYKPVYIDGLGWISDKPQCEHIEYSKERYYAELVNRARAGLERIRIAGRETAVGVGDG